MQMEPSKDLALPPPASAKRKGQYLKEVLALVFGAAEESRTLDLYLGKVSLYQLSYCRIERELYRLIKERVKHSAHNLMVFPKVWPCHVEVVGHGP